MLWVFDYVLCCCCHVAGWMLQIPCTWYLLLCIKYVKIRVFLIVGSVQSWVRNRRGGGWNTREEEGGGLDNFSKLNNWIGGRKFLKNLISALNFFFFFVNGKITKRRSNHTGGHATRTVKPLHFGNTNTRVTKPHTRVPLFFPSQKNKMASIKNFICAASACNLVPRAILKNY